MSMVVSRTLGCLLIFLAGCTSSAPGPIASLAKGHKAIAIVFLAPDCPLSQNYTPTLNELRAQFHTSAMELYGVFSGKAAAAGAEEFAKTYGLQFPIVRDADLQIADFLKATTTPEVFVIDELGSTIYSGAIDNRAPELGQRRTVITEKYLQDALKNIVDGVKVGVERTQPVGCFIERPS
jgi:hypothetical protein